MVGCRNVGGWRVIGFAGSTFPSFLAIKMMHCLSLWHLLFNLFSRPNQRHMPCGPKESLCGAAPLAAPVPPSGEKGRRSSLKACRSGRRCSRYSRWNPVCHHKMSYLMRRKMKVEGYLGVSCVVRITTGGFHRKGVLEGEVPHFLTGTAWPVGKVGRYWPCNG